MRHRSGNRHTRRNSHLPRVLSDLPPKSKDHSCHQMSKESWSKEPKLRNGSCAEVMEWHTNFASGSDTSRADHNDSRSGELQKSCRDGSSLYTLLSNYNRNLGCHTRPSPTMSKYFWDKLNDSVMWGSRLRGLFFGVFSRLREFVRSLENASRRK